MAKQYLLLAVTSQVTITQVICHNENDIGPAAGQVFRRYCFAIPGGIFIGTGSYRQNARDQADCG